MLKRINRTKIAERCHKNNTNMEERVKMRSFQIYVHTTIEEEKENRIERKRGKRERGGYLPRECRDTTDGCARDNRREQRKREREKERKICVMKTWTCNEWMPLYRRDFVESREERKQTDTKGKENKIAKSNEKDKKNDYEAMGETWVMGRLEERKKTRN